MRQATSASPLLAPSNCNCVCVAGSRPGCDCRNSALPRRKRDRSPLTPSAPSCMLHEPSCPSAPPLEISPAHRVTHRTAPSPVAPGMSRRVWVWILHTAAARLSWGTVPGWCSRASCVSGTGAGRGPSSGNPHRRRHKNAASCKVPPPLLINNGMLLLHVLVASNVEPLESPVSNVSALRGVSQRYLRLVFFSSSQA